MNDLQNLQCKIFQESKDLLFHLSKVSSAEELILAMNEVQDLYQKASFLKISMQNKETPMAPSSEKKIKLGHIKDLKLEVQFDENINKEEVVCYSSESKKNNIKLDLNDTLAFSKKLFNDNEVLFQKTIDELNAFESEQEAKEFLSDMYYRYDWKKVDEYAQRLWLLTENKFKA